MIKYILYKFRLLQRKKGGEENLSDQPEKKSVFTNDASDQAFDDPADQKTPSEEADGSKTDAAPAAEKSAADKKTQPKQPKKKKTTAQLLIGFLIKLAVIALAVWLLFTFILGIVIHYGNNMHPAISDGDLVITLRVQRPYLDAAVMYEHDGKSCIGRVVGMPGDEIDISDNGALTVNGIAPAEEVFYPTYRCETSDIAYPYTLGEDQVFILNDFRTNTNDSRSFGAVDMKDVKGPVLIMLRRRGF